MARMLDAWRGHAPSVRKGARFTGMTTAVIRQEPINDRYRVQYGPTGVGRERKFAVPDSRRSRWLSEAPFLGMVGHDRRQPASL